MLLGKMSGWPDEFRGTSWEFSFLAQQFCHLLGVLNDVQMAVCPCTGTRHAHSIKFAKGALHFGPKVQCRFRVVLGSSRVGTNEGSDIGQGRDGREGGLGVLFDRRSALPGNATRIGFQ